MPRFERYTRTAVLLHWMIAALLFAEFAHGWWMQEIPKQPPGIRADAFNMHKSVGLLLLALVLVRLGWRLAHRPPVLLPVARWQAVLARSNHVLLYAMMVAMPLSGYLGSVFSGYPIKWFGLILPAWGWADPAIKELMSSVHLATSWILLASTSLHVAGTIKHAIAGERVMARMSLGGDDATPPIHRPGIATPRP
ncbi:MAG TPA: cytochrome b/b6 domain-containing protein [Casimicrobiaceae bacterium]|nr:cytochrome b/b6 domain-containing protein [Casimicrobiaceae bacterium]